jgi:two-component system cell cycle response regulator
MRVLIADDDFTSRNILTAILKKWGYDPLATKDGVEAWDVLQQPDSPKLVLLDWDMPGMEGLEVCRRLREHESNNPPYVILLTARGEKRDIVQGLEAGANDYIAKPYDNAELQARIGVGRRMLELQASLMEARDALEYLAMHDPLTGVFNRRAILDRLKAEISRAQREGGTLSVGMCDLDHFKDVNDAYGHQAGDDVLIAFTRCVQANLRGYDSVGRYGGEEFLLVAAAPKGPVEGNLYERLCAQVAATEIETKAGTASITVSIGVAPGTGESTVDALLAAADAVLYQAKAGGRNRVAYAIQTEPLPRIAEMCTGGSGP